MTETFFETLTKQTNDLFSAKNKQKVMIKIGFTPLADCNILPFLKGFLNNGNNGKNYNIGGGPTPFLYTHLVYIWQKSDGHVH